MIATIINDILTNKNKLSQNKYWISHSTLDSFVEYFDNMDAFEVLLFNRKYDAQNTKSFYFCNNLGTKNTLLQQQSTQLNNLFATKNANKKPQTLQPTIHCKKIINTFICEMVDYIADGLMTTPPAQPTTLITAISTICYFFATTPTPQIEITRCCFIEFAKSKVKWIKLFHQIIGQFFTMDTLRFYVKNNYYTLQTDFIQEPTKNSPLHYDKINNVLIDEVMDFVLQHLKNYSYFLGILNNLNQQIKTKLQKFDNSVRSLFADYRNDETFAKNTDRELLDFCFYNYFVTIWLVYYLQIRYEKGCNIMTVKQCLEKDALFSALIGSKNDGKKFDANLQYDIIIDNLFDE